MKYGSGSYMIDGRIYDVTTGDIILVGRGVPHRPSFAPGNLYDRYTLYISVKMLEDFDIPERREYIDRPVVDSGKLTSSMNADTLRQVQREMALWRLFAARAEAEPDAALLPALQHYREGLRLLSSIRQERIALSSDDFKLYQRLLDKRRVDVNEWFVVLDKAVAMRDWDRARRQARWIMSHATLIGERADVRRAADVLATKIPPEDGGNGEKQ